MGLLLLDSTNSAHTSETIRKSSGKSTKLINALMDKTKELQIERDADTELDRHTKSLDVMVNMLCLCRLQFISFFFLSLPSQGVNDTGANDDREEGEIIDSDSNFEYEAISSDEEFTLRQKIEALEERNSELAKIATISARAQEVYG